MLIRSLYLVSVFPNKPVSFWSSTCQFGPLCPLSLDPGWNLACSPKKVKLDPVLQSIFVFMGPHKTVGTRLQPSEEIETGRHLVQLAQEKSASSSSHRQSLPCWPLTNWQGSWALTLLPLCPHSFSPHCQSVLLGRGKNLRKRCWEEENWKSWHSSP